MPPFFEALPFVGALASRCYYPDATKRCDVQHAASCGTLMGLQVASVGDKTRAEAPCYVWAATPLTDNPLSRYSQLS